MVDNLAYASGGRGGGGGPLTLVHSPAVSPAVDELSSIAGKIRGTVVLDISDISAFTAITAGTFNIGSENVTGIDLSGAASINDVVNLITAAVQANAALSMYQVRVDYINPNFYGAVFNQDGDVAAISGTIEPLFGLANPAENRAHVPSSPFIVLPEKVGGGDWRHLSFYANGQTYQSADWFFEADFFALESGNLSNYFSLNNSGGWTMESFAGPGELQIGVVEAYNVAYFNVFYDPATRTFSWQPSRTAPSANTWMPNINTLKVLGQ